MSRNRPINRRIKSTGRCSDVYGACELCGKRMPECYKTQWQYEDQKNIKNWACRSFGHLECLQKIDAYKYASVVGYA